MEYSIHYYPVPDAEKQKKNIFFFCLPINAKVIHSISFRAHNNATIVVKRGVGDVRSEQFIFHGFSLSPCAYNSNYNITNTHTRTHAHTYIRYIICIYITLCVKHWQIVIEDNCYYGTRNALSDAGSGMIYRGGRMDDDGTWASMLY